MKISALPHGLLLFAVLSGSSNFAVRANALTIYRIGGTDQPPPQVDVPFEFVQLRWEVTGGGRLGETEALEIHSDFIAPQQLDSAVNLIPSIAGSGRVSSSGREVTSRESSYTMFDGNSETAFLGDRSTLDTGSFFNRRENRGVNSFKFWVFDLEGLFFIQKIRFYPRDRFHFERFVESFVVGTSDGDALKAGTRDLQIWFGPDFDLIHQIRENNNAVIELPLPPEPIRQLFFGARKNIFGPWEIAEFEIYGMGFTTCARYLSNIIDLGSPLSLGSLSWEGSQPLGAQILLSTRLGDDIDPNVYWRHTFRGDEKTRLDHQGLSLTQETYKRLELGERAGTTHDTKHWTNWSAAFDFRAQKTALPAEKPRRFVQLKAEFHSTATAGGRLGYLQFAVSKPRVARVFAEIVPAQVSPGVPTDFTYKILPRFAGEETGFDRVEIDTPTQALSVDAVHVGGAEVAFDVERLDEKGFVVRIPRIDVFRTNERIEVDFRAEVFQYGTLFTGRITDSSRPHEVPQELTPGDADPLEGGNTLKVDLTNLQSQKIWALQLTPPIFTPNGDGINDVVQIEYILVNLGSPAVVTLTIYDLSGYRQKQILRVEEAGGHYRAVWNGEGGQGERLLPGCYILRLEVETDQGMESAQRLISLAY